MRTIEKITAVLLNLSTEAVFKLLDKEENLE